MATTKLTAERVLAWRMRRHLLDRPAGVDAVGVVRRLVGVQAQVASAAEQAVAARQASPRPGTVTTALAGRTLVKTWAMRGTLHLLSPADAADCLSLLAAGRFWEKRSWQRSFVMIIPADRRAAVSRAAGWISPVVVHRGRVVGTWEPRDGEPVVTLWPESPPVPIERLDAERARLRSYLKKSGDA